MLNVSFVVRDPERDLGPCVKPNPVAFTVTKLRHESVIANTAFGDSVRPSLASIFANVASMSDLTKVP